MNIRNLLIACACLASITAPLAAQAGEPRNREVRQEQRIYQGVKNGTISQREYNCLQASETRINNQRTEDLENNNGHLSAAEYRQLNREENRQSRAIYKDKHNDPTPSKP